MPGLQVNYNLKNKNINGNNKIFTNKKWGFMALEYRWTLESEFPSRWPKDSFSDLYTVLMKILRVTIPIT